MKTEPHHSINSGTFDPLIDTNGGIKQEQISAINKGLTKREYFAAMAMMGLLANTHLISKCASKAEDNKIEWREQASIEAVEITDALIKALNKTQP